MEEKRSFVSAISGMFRGIVKPIEYVENSRHSSWFSTFLVILIVSIVVPFLTFFLPVNNLYGAGKLADKIDEKLPDFVLTDQGFSCVGQNIWSNDLDLYFCIDTRVNMVSEDMVQDIISSGAYSTIVVIAHKNIFLYSLEYNNGESIYKDWSDIYNSLNELSGHDQYSKSEIIRLFRKWDTPVIVSAYIFLAIITFIAYYIAILFWGMLGLIFNGTGRTNLSYGNLCKMAVYIRAPWYIIKKLLINYVYYDGKTVLWILMFVIIAVYLYAAIRAYANKLREDIVR